MNNTVNYTHLSNEYYSTFQPKLPLEVGIKIDSDDPVVTFSEILEGVNLRKYLVSTSQETRGRNGYDCYDMLKVVLFAYMLNIRSTRKIANACKYDVRFMFLSDSIRPSHMSICNFINDYLIDNVENIFIDINKYIIEKLNIDISTIFIDGTKIEAFPNKYSWVWKNACLTSRKNQFKKITNLYKEINNEVQIKIPLIIQEEYEIEELERDLEVIKCVLEDEGIPFVYGRGKRKHKFQRCYDDLSTIIEKLKEYATKIETCGDHRNSYSKTDKDATFMRMKTDYMGNTALLPAYNWQVASAGYGNLETYTYCEKRGIGKFIKFPMWQKETHNKKFHNNIFRAVNFKVDEEGNLICPNNKKLMKERERYINNKADHRVVEYYTCEDCEGCPLREQCHKSQGNRKVQISHELTRYHKEVIDLLASEEGIELRKTRSYMAEGVFGIVKQDYGYKRISRISLKKVNLEFYLVSVGFNLAKYHNILNRENQIIN